MGEMSPPLKKRKMKFNTLEHQILSEIRRRISEFKDGDKDKPMIYLGYPSEVKSLVEKGIITPYSSETPRALNWYNLTDKGKWFI